MKLRQQIEDATRPLFELKHLILGIAAAGKTSPTEDEKNALGKYVEALWQSGVISLSESVDLITQISNSATRANLNEVKLSIFEIEPAGSPPPAKGEKDALNKYVTVLLSVGMLKEIESIHFTDDITNSTTRSDFNKLKIKLIFRYGSPDTTPPASAEKQMLTQYLEALRDAGLIAPSKCSELSTQIEQAATRKDFKQVLDIIVDEMYDLCKLEEIPSTNTLAVTGTVYRETGEVAEDGLPVEVNIITQGLTETGTTGTAGKGQYSVTFFDAQKPVAKAGDEILVTVKDAQGKLVGQSRHTLTAAEVEEKITRLDVIPNGEIQFTLKLYKGIKEMSCCKTIPTHSTRRPGFPIN